MARFKPGQEVVCIKTGDWRCSITGAKLSGPKFGEVVTIENIYEQWLYLVGYNALQGFLGDRERFHDIRFEPLVDITELTSILEEQPAEA